MGLVRKSWILGFLLLFHATAESFQTDLGEGSGSGDVGLIDDEDDYGSGSGSREFDLDSDELPDSDSENGSEEDSSDVSDGDGVDEEDVRVDNRIPEGSIPNQKVPEIENEETVVENNEIARNVPHLVDKNTDNAIVAKVQSSAQGSSLQRTEVLAAIIAGGVVGLLLAIALIAFLVLRMRKKEEGNCIVGKNAEPAYQRANTEIYA